jgi:hypothetical protein
MLLLGLTQLVDKGPLGIVIGPDPHDRSNTIITRVEKGSRGDIYGLKVGELCFVNFTTLIRSLM